MLKKENDYVTPNDLNIKSNNLLNLKELIPNYNNHYKYLLQHELLVSFQTLRLK